MPVRICRCCGQKMEQTERGNPNVCADCTRCLEDSSPIRAAHLAAAAPQKPLLDIDPVEALIQRTGIQN